VSDSDFEELPSVVLDRLQLTDTGLLSRRVQVKKSVDVDSDAVLAPTVDPFGRTGESVRPQSEWPFGGGHGEPTPADGHGDLYREIQQAVIRESTEEGIDRVVCESLVDSGRYAAAAVYTVTLAAEDVHPRTVAGESGVPDTGASQATETDVGVLGEAALAAASSGETNVVHVESDADRSEVVPRDGHGTEDCWILAVPMSFEDVRYGVLTVCATREDGFEERERTVLEELALTVGHALNSVRWRQSFVGESYVELDVWLPNQFDGSELSIGHRDGDTTVTVEETLPSGTGSVVQYLTVVGQCPASFRSAMAEMKGVESVRKVDDDGDRSRFEVIYDDFPLMSTLVSYGGRIETIHFDLPDLYATVVVPLTVDVRQLVEALHSDRPDLKVGAQRTAHRTRKATAPYEDGLEELTARQRAAVLAAFFAGYFSWPRGSTAEEIASTLDVSSPTFHYHLRLAQQKLLSRTLERDRLDDR
jgi:hypothetical protein